MTIQTITDIRNWFKVAVPHPDDKMRDVQLGVHLEEVAEMIASTEFQTYHEVMFGEQSAAHEAIVTLSKALKSGIALSKPSDRKEFADSLCDQIVTAIGLAYAHGIDIEGALDEVNKSNWSKFTDGKAEFDENGKIKKGAGYVKPDLSRFV